MEMEEASAELEPGEPQRGDRPGVQPHTRIDWRTGRPTQVMGAEFWKEHAVRRMEQGLSVAAYCDANGLAKSTFRRYAAAGRTDLQGSPAHAQGAKQTCGFIALAGSITPTESMVVEIETGNGMKLRLSGSAADRLLQHVLARFA